MKYILLIIAFTFTTVLAWEAGRRTEKNKKQGDGENIIKSITLEEDGLISFTYTQPNGRAMYIYKININEFNNWLKLGVTGILKKGTYSCEQSITIIPSGIIGHPCEQ